MDFALYIESVIALLIAGLLLFRGLKIYVIFQMAICGLLGGYVGLIIVQKLANPNLMFIALITTAIGAHLGRKYYYVAFYIVAAISTFLVVFSYYWNQALEAFNAGVGDIVKTKDVAFDSFKNMDDLTQIGQVINNITSTATANINAVVSQATSIIQHGVFIALIAAMVMGVLAIWISDYVIIIVTSGVGAMILVNVVEEYVPLASLPHLVVLIAVAIAGLAVQMRVKH